jgi:outer membrane biosynthesis protein TonB
VKFRGTSKSHKGAGSVDEPMPTVSAGGIHVAEVRAFLTTFYGSGSVGQRADKPMRTVTTKDRLGLVIVAGVEYALVDIGMRMLEPDELKHAQFGRFAKHCDLSAAKTKAGKVAHRQLGVPRGRRGTRRCAASHRGGSREGCVSAIPSLIARLGLQPAADLSREEDEPEHIHAVENGVINYLSVSQLKDFSMCERLWFLGKVLRLPKKQFKAQVIGTEVHAQNEHYLKTGEDVLGEIAREMKPFLPAPGPDLLIEEHFGEPSPLFADRIPLTGYIDLVNPRRLKTEGVLRITDHKTTKSITKYAAAPADLANVETGAGIQMVGYAYWAVLAAADRFPGLQLIELEHIYTQTQGKKLATNALITVTPALVENQWVQKIEPMARRMREVARAKSLDEVKPTWSACKNFGGCSFQAQCLIHQTKAKERSMGIADRVLNRPPVTATPPPAATEPPKRHLQIVDSSTVPDAKPAEQPKPETPPAQPVATIVPPDAPKSDPKLAAEQPPPPPAPEPEKTKKPRAAKATASTEPVLKVYVDAMPNAVESQPLAGYVAGIVGDMERTFKCIDIRCATKKYKTDEGQELENPLAYGGWKGVLAAAIKVQPPPPATYVVLGASGSEIMQVVTEALEALCAPGNFTRGVR